VSIHVVRTLSDYPAGLIGTISALFGRTIAASHGVDWTLDVMLAEEQCAFFRRFDPDCDRVWVALAGAVPMGGLTIEGPRDPAASARLRFFILDESLRGRGVGRRLLADGIEYCRTKGWQGIYLTTLPGLDAALHLYRDAGFILKGETPGSFHGSNYAEQIYERLL